MLLKVFWDKQIHIVKSNNASTLQKLKEHIHQIFKERPAKYYLAYIDEDNDEIILQSETDYKILLNNGVKTVKIIIKEKCEDFYDETQKIQLVELEPRESMSHLEQIMKNDSILNQQSEIKNNSNSVNLEQSIEAKIMLMLPNIVSRIKTEISLSLSNNCEPNLSKQENKPQSKSPKVVHLASCDGCGVEDIEGIRYKCSVCPDFDYCQKCEATIDHPHPFLKIKNLSQTPIKIFAVIRDENTSLQINGNKVNCPRLSGGCQMNNELHIAQQFMRQRMCPFMNPQQKAQKQQDTKTETKETKIQVKSDPKTGEKIEIKMKSQPTIEKVQEKKVINIKERDEGKSNKQKQLNQTLILQNAKYLANLAQITYAQASRISANHPYLTKEQLLELYLNGGI